MYMTLEELTHEQQMIEEYGDTFMFFGYTHTSDGKPYMHRQDAAEIFVNAIPSEITTLKMVDNRGRFAIIHPYTKGDNSKWQVSYFDQRGAYGDGVRDTRNDAIKAAIECGFTTIEEVVYQ